jgi:subtilase family serine protease
MKFVTVGSRSRNPLSRIAMLLLVMNLAWAATGHAQQNSSIANNTPGFIKKAVDLGPTDPSAVISVTVWLQLHNEQQLQQLVQQQYQKGSPNFHKWITQDQFNSTFGPTSQEVNSLINFLSAKDLTVLTIAENNMYVKVQGTVSQIQSAFKVSLHNYSFGGKTYRSNTADPNVNDPSGAHVAAISGMDDYGFQPTNVRPVDADGNSLASVPLSSAGPNGAFFESQCFRGVETQTFKNTSTSTTATYNGNRYGADISNNNLGHLPPCGYQPSELHAAYNMNALYGAGLDGGGETVVITDAFGAPNITSDAEIFSQVYGLPDITPQNFQILRAPGAVNNPVNNGHIGPSAGWADEITLDVEWVHAMAPGAKIILVIGPNNTADLDEAVNYAVVHHLGNTISNSWSSIEGFGNPAQFNRDNRILQMAAAQGIDVNFSSGDSGDFAAAVGFKTVGFPGSSPFATSIGGTSLALNPNNTIAFQTGWGNNLTRIANRVSEGSTPVDPPLSLGFNGGAGGGTSLTFAKPVFQSSLPGSMRLVPDISLLADPFTGVEIIETINGQTSVSVIGGTSLACPMFSAVMAIAAQKNGHHGFGQAAAQVYNLPTGAVSDVVPVSSPNNVTGTIVDSSGTTFFSADQLAAPLGNTTSYYSAMYNSPFSTRWFVITFGTDSSLTTAPGWDNVTGVGTPNGAGFVNALAP